MSAAVTAPSAVASATAGRTAGRPRANAKVCLRPVPPDARSARDSGGSHFLLSGERCLAAPRARRVVSTPDRRPDAFPDGRDRAVTLDTREKAPLLVVPSVLRARAPSRSRSPTCSAPVRRRLDVHRTRRAPLRASLDPADPPPTSETGRASRPQVRRHGRAQRALPRHGASPREPRPRRAPHSRIFPPFRDCAPIREKCRFGAASGGRTARSSSRSSARSSSRRRARRRGSHPF